MSDPFAQPTDVEGIWRPLTEAETTVVINRIVQASEYIRQQFRLAGRDADAEIASGRLTVDLLRAVTADMVHRVMLNPDKLRTFASSIDDRQKSGTLDNAISAGDIYLTDRELALLGISQSGSRAFTIAPGWVS